MASKVDRPGACHNFHRAVRKLAKYCIKVKLLAEDPTKDIELPKLDPNGRRAWSDEHIAMYERRWPIGSMERLALALALYLALRREDLIVIGAQHIENGVLHFCPQKTQRSTGVVLAIPIHPELASILDATSSTHPTFLINQRGKPFLPGSFSQWFAAACKSAGLPRGLSVHGLRKAACRRLAEAGCSAHQIMAISGHTTLKEVERYTKGAEMRRMARSAIKMVAGAFRAATEQVIDKPF